MSTILQRKKVISVITCRGMWRRGYKIFERKVRAKGGKVISNLVVEDQLRQPFNMVTTVHSLLTGKDIEGKILRKLFLPFGVGANGLETARDFAKDMSGKLWAGAL